METKNHPNTIDLEAVLKKGKPFLYKIIPQFVLNYIKRLVRQEDLNRLINLYGDNYGVAFIDKCLNDKNVKHEVVGIENIPKGPKYVFASNHPYGGLDGLILLSLVEKQFGSVKAVVNEILLNVKNIKPVYVGVNIFGHTTREQLINMNNLYESDDQIIVFPAGLVSREQPDGTIKDLTWKKSFLTKAIQYKRDIIPVYFEGTNSERFYKWARIRKRLRLKVNIEMFLLPDEMFKKANSFVKVTFGKPIPYQTFDRRFSQDEWAEKIKDVVYSLGTGKEIDLKIKSI